MKKLLVLAGISTLLFLGSCVTSKVPVVKAVFDNSVPIEESSWVNLYMYSGIITAYNGISVSGWKTGSWDMIQIPAGDTTMEIDLDAIGDNRYIAKGMMFRYNFQPQKQYYIRFIDPDFWSSWNQEITGGKYGVGIYAWDIGEKISYKDTRPNFVEFVPFLIQPVFVSK
jgi:hypothetical protein